MVGPQVTVGLPVYGDAECVRRGVPTVFGQTWGGQVRFLIIDDGTSEHMRAVLGELASVYDGIEIVRNERSEGRSAVCNKIVQLAGDDYLAWIDAGDLWHPRKLEVQFDALLEAERERPGEPLLCVGPFRSSLVDREEEPMHVPDVEGDQLYSVLTGRLLPYLPAIVGRAEHFRSVSGFDLRLTQRHDYDFLVRFLAEGGKVVRSPDDVPVLTHLETVTGEMAKDIAAANRILRRKHRPYYKQYGRVSRRIRGEQHALVATYHRDNGARVRSLGYGTLAGLAEPLEFGRRIAGRFQPSRMARAAARLPAKALRPALPYLQRTEVLEFVRRAGIFKVVSRAGLTSRLLVDLKSEVEDTSGSSPYPTTKPGELPVDAVRIEQEISDAESSIPVDRWLRLEATYRIYSLLHSAESALRRGLSQHPDDAELRARLIELLGMRRKWADCVELWSNSALSPRDLRGLTYARAARSFRELGEYQRAHQVAEAGFRQWPDDFRVVEEFQLSRAALTDWKDAVRSSGTRTEDVVAPDGVVSDLGFLAGSEAPMRGKVTAQGSHTVSLMVNGVRIATTRAVDDQSDDGLARFSLSCHELLHYLGDGDVVWVESDGQRLAITGGGASLAVEAGYPSRMPELKRQLAAGYVFTKLGTLRKGYTRERRKHTLALFDEVSSLIADSHGFPTYPFYGHLLGAVREHDFIPHDAGGFDMGYVSSDSAPEGVRREFMDILLMLVARGYHLRLEPWSTYVRPSNTSRVFVDLNYAWFNGSGELNLSFGWRHEPVTDRDRFFMYRESLIGDRFVRVPGNAEDVLQQIYGPDWAVPDQGFILGADVRRDERYLLTVDEMRSVEQLDPDRVVAILDHHPVATSGDMAGA